MKDYSIDFPIIVQAESKEEAIQRAYEIMEESAKLDASRINIDYGAVLSETDIVELQDV